MGANGGHVHREVMELEASPARVHEFVMTPERILDYYPAPLEGGVLGVRDDRQGPQQRVPGLPKPTAEFLDERRVQGRRSLDHTAASPTSLPSTVAIGNP